MLGEYSGIIRSDGLSEGRDGVLRGHDHTVEGLDNRDFGPVNFHPDWEDYINGNLQFAVEYVGRGWDGTTKRGGRYWHQIVPCDVWLVLAEANLSVKWKIGDAIPAEFGPAEECIVAYWGQKPMLVPKVELMNQPEVMVASRIRVWPQAPDCFDELLADSMGESLLSGSVQPLRFTAKRKLDGTIFVPGNERGDNLPIGVIKGGPEIVNDVPADDGCLVYDGFVLFGERRTFAGLCICLKDVSEGALLCEKLDKVFNVFRGPINLEGCAIHHGQI